MRSLRSRLFLVLTIATSLVWLSATVWIMFGTQRELQQVLDTRLMEAARMVASLAAQGHGSDAAAEFAIRSAPNTGNYSRQLSCQIWSLDGKLVGRSSGAPDEVLSNVVNGFSDRTVNGETWRVYAVTTPGGDQRVLVGDSLALRERLVQELLWGLLLPGLLILPVLALLIWATAGRGLRPLNELAGNLQARGPDDLTPVCAQNPPAEIQPVIRGLNDLFSRLSRQRDHERSFTAYAAHELRTPLAALRAQAQIARLAPDDTARNNALGQIEAGVDRTARLISQLLAMAHLDASESPSGVEAINPGREIAAVAAQVRSEGVATVVDPALHEARLVMNRELFHLAVRNLHENAIQHSPAGGAVHWRLGVAGAKVSLIVEDAGQGLPEDELARATERFFRGRSARHVGSGLGLAIARAALARAGASLTLGNRPDGPGLQAIITTDSLKTGVATGAVRSS